MPDSNQRVTLHNSFLLSVFSSSSGCAADALTGSSFRLACCASACAFCLASTTSLTIAPIVSARSAATPAHASCHDATLTLPRGARGNEMSHSA